MQQRVVEALKGYDDSLEILTLERDSRIEKAIEEAAAQKFKKINDIRETFDIQIKRLQVSKLKDKAEAKKQERDSLIKIAEADVEAKKRKVISHIKEDFAKRKRDLLSDTSFQQSTNPSSLDII